MKRFLTVLIVILGINIGLSVFADDMPNNLQPEDISTQARILYAQNEIDDALKILSSKPDDKRTAEDWLIIGNILQDKDKLDDAVFMYKQALNVDHKYYKAHYNLGYIYLNQEKPNLALEEFKKTVKYNPTFSYGYYNLACAHLKLKNYKSARYNFYRAMDIKANEPNTYYNLSYTYKMLNNEKKAKIYLDLYNKMMESHEL